MRCSVASPEHGASEQETPRVDPTAKPNTVDEHIELIRSVPLFSRLSDSEIADLAQHVTPQRLGRNVQLYGPGETNASLRILHSGRVKIYRVTASGHQQLLRILGSGDFLGEAALLSEQTFDHFAVTLEPSDVCTLGHNTFKGLVLRNPSIGWHMLEALSSRVQTLEHQVSDQNGETLDRRLADALLKLADEAGENAFTLPMAKQDLASYLGVTASSLSRTLAEFEELGWIRQQAIRRIEITNRPALTPPIRKTEDHDRTHSDRSRAGDH